MQVWFFPYSLSVNIENLTFCNTHIKVDTRQYDMLKTCQWIKGWPKSHPFIDMRDEHVADNPFFKCEQKSCVLVLEQKLQHSQPGIAPS